MIQNSVIKKTFPKVQLLIMAYIAYAYVPAQGEVYFRGRKRRSGNLQYLLHLSDLNTFKWFPMKDVSM